MNDTNWRWTTMILNKKAQVPHYDSPKRKNVCILEKMPRTLVANPTQES